MILRVAAGIIAGFLAGFATGLGLMALYEEEYAEARGRRAEADLWLDGYTPDGE